VRFGAVEFRRGSEPHLAIAQAARGGRAVIWAVVNLKALGEITREAQPAAVGVAYVVDASGQLLSHPDPSLVLRRTDMAGLPHVRAALAVDRATSADDARALDGTPVFAAAAPVPRLGWTVIVEQPQRQALAPVWGSLARSAALTALGVALAVAASAWLAGRLVRPIRALQARAADIAAGQLDQRIELASGDEVQALGEQFNRMAAKLQALYASLEARVADRTRELADANEAKSRFLAAASHDLRQPVHALGLFAGQLRQAPDHDAQRALVGDIERAVAAFEALLASLLDISRLDAGSVAVQRTPVALGPLLDRLAGGFAPAVVAKGLRLRTRSTALWVDSDPVLLERVLLNLLGNALRYTARGGVLLAARPRGAAVELWMVDTGIGIAPEHQASVFDEFFRVPGVRAGGEVGLGLGLAIVRRLVALLGHGLVLRSVLGRGSAFVLTLPRAAPAALELVPLAAAEPLAGRRVLVVDDDAAVREATRGQLAQWGCEVTVAADGAQALARQAAGAPEIVLTDLRLADGEDGLAVAQRLRERAAVPVVVITGDTVPARLRAARETGCTVLTKPLQPARLRAVLEALLPARPPR
jgi:signal transduction histidine kinase